MSTMRPVHGSQNPQQQGRASGGEGGGKRESGGKRDSGGKRESGPKTNPSSPDGRKTSRTPRRSRSKEELRKKPEEGEGKDDEYIETTVIVIREESPPPRRGRGRQRKGWIVREDEIVIVDKTDRRKFVRKVMSILATQLLFCTIICAIAVFVEAVSMFMKKHWYIALIAMAVYISLEYAVMCCHVGEGPTNCCNVSILIIYTMCLSYVLAFLCTYYEINVILLALGTTAAIFFIVTLITIFTKLDVTSCWVFPLVLGLVILVFGLMVLILYLSGSLTKGEYKVLHLIISFLCVILATFYLMWDMQMILGGRRFELTEEMWLFAAISLFGDLAFIFISLLSIFSFFSGD